VRVALAFVLGGALGWVARELFASLDSLSGPDVGAIDAPTGGDEAVFDETPAGQRVAASADSRAPSAAERQRRAERQRETMRALASGQPEERLRLARDVLAEDGIGPLTMRALSVLAELEPRSAVSELRQRVDEAGGETSGLGMAASILTQLGRVDGALTSEDLRAFFDTGTVDVRVAAAKILAERGDDGLVTRFLDDCAAALDDGDTETRLEAVRKLAMFRTPESFALLAECFEDPADEVRLQAVRSVGFGTQDPAVIEALRALEDDPSEPVRRAAERQLEMLERLPAIRRR